MKRILSIILLLSALWLTACSYEVPNKASDIQMHITSLDECKLSETKYSRYFTDKTDGLEDNEEIRKDFDRMLGLVEMSEEVDGTSVCANFEVYDYSDFMLELLTLVCKVKDLPKYCVYTMATVKAEKKLDNFNITHLPQGEETQLLEFLPIPGKYTENDVIFDAYIGPFSFNDSLVFTGEVKGDHNSIYWEYKWENPSEVEYYWENNVGVTAGAPQWTFMALSVYKEESDSLVCDVGVSFVMDDIQHKFEIDFSYLKDEQDSVFTVR